jgi:hypothetical protein
MLFVKKFHKDSKKCEEERGETEKGRKERKGKRGKDVGMINPLWQFIPIGWD